NLEIFLQCHYDLNAKNIYGENILGEVYLKAIANGYLDIVKKLINIGVDKNYESYGENGIDTAIEYNSTEVLKYLREIGVKEN
ncbi:MAG: ankyrin repeat domain-containing protein, partial [Cetobacterium sp.]|nr:ankyrin repeat domain-containing protein [Cetobacterium sp.]